MTKYCFDPGHGLPGAPSRRKRILYTTRLQRFFGAGRGVKEANFYVLRKTDAPAVLVECGFIDNPQDAMRLANVDFLDQIAAALEADILP